MDEVQEIEIKGNEKQENWLVKYVQENPLSVLWVLLLSVGGVVLFSFHLGLGYLPDFQLTDLFGIFVGTTLTGALFLFFVMAFGLMPAYFLRLYDAQKPRPSSMVGANDDEKPNLDGARNSNSSDSKKTNRQPMEERLFGSGFDHVFLWLVPPILFGFAILLNTEILPTYPIASKCIKWGISLLLLLIGFFYFLETNRKLRLQAFVYRMVVEKVLKSSLVRVVSIVIGVVYEWMIRKPAQLLNFPKIIGFVIWLTLSLLPAYLAFLFAEIGLQKDRAMTFVLFVLFFGFFNALIYIAINKEKLIAILMLSTLFVCTMIPLMANQPLLFPNVIVRLLSLGNVSATSLTLSYKQCHLLAPAGVNCPQNVERDAQMSLQNVNILSKVGSSILVEVVGVSDLEEKLVGEFDNSNLSLVKFDQNSRTRLCKTKVDGAVPDACSSCDDIVLEQAMVSLQRRLSSEIADSDNKRQTEKQGNVDKKTVDEKLEKFRRSLVCYRVLIPKDQISNIGFGGRRSYTGFTRYILPEQKK